MDAQEIVQLVDENDNCIGPIERQNIREQNLPHRCTYIFIFNSQDKLWVHKRTNLKSWCPGFWDPAFGGVVQHNESYELNAQRELQEEAGVNCDLEYLFKFWFTNETSKCWCAVFKGIHDGPLTLQKEEVEKVELMSIEEIQEFKQKGEKITPDGWMALEKIIELGKQKK